MDLSWSFSSSVDEKHTGVSEATQCFNVNGPKTLVPAIRTPPLPDLAYMKLVFLALEAPWAELPRQGIPGKHWKEKLELKYR